MSKTILFRGIVAAAAAGTALVGTAPAQAATPQAVLTSSISTSASVIDGDAACSNRVKVSVTIHDPKTANQEFSWSTEVTGPGGVHLWPDLRESGHAGDYFYYTADVRLCGSNTPGAYTVDSAIERRTSETSATYQHSYQHFAIKRPTSLTFSVPAKTGQGGGTFTAKGVLKFDPYARGYYYGKSGVVLKFYFLPTNGKEWLLRGNVVTGKNGAYAKKLTATTTGTWQVVYSGDSTHQARTTSARISVPR